MELKRNALFIIVGVFVAMATGAPTIQDDVLHDLMMQLCGWDGSGGGQQLADRLKQSLGVGDGVLTSVSCNEAPERIKQKQKPVPARVQKQVIFIHMEEAPVVYVPPAGPPRVVVYVLPREERHTINVVDKRPRVPPMVRFLGGDTRRSESFDIIPALNYDY